MINYALPPTNSHTLSDNVIGDVVQRVRSVRHLQVEDGRRQEIRPIQMRTTPIPGLSKTSIQISHCVSTSDNAAAPSVHQDEITAEKWIQPAFPLVSMESLQSKLSPDLLDNLQRMECKRRERNRTKQQAYRNRQNRYVLDLQSDIRQLQSEIQRLKQRRDFCFRKVPLEMSSWKVVTEYFRLFRNGLKSYDKLSVQAMFLESAMAPDVLFTGGHGVEMLVDKWQSATLHHKNLHIDLVGLENGVEGSMVADFIWYSTINEKMLRGILPHLSNNGDADKFLSLAVKLLGTRFGVPSSARFYWDETKSRILIIHYSSDMITPLLKLLGTLADVSFALNSGAVACWADRL